MPNPKHLAYWRRQGTGCLAKNARKPIWHSSVRRGAALPFGGFKQAGWGRECGKEVLELYTEVKTVVMPR